jgi:hypothetical protein
VSTPRERLRRAASFTLTLAIVCIAFAVSIAAPVQAATPGEAAKASLAIVVRDQTPLRAGPHDAAPQQALLWQGEVVEVRGEHLDYLQIWDYGRERGGFVEASRVRLVALTAEQAPKLLAVLRFVRDTPGAEALGIGFATAYLQAATPEALRGEGGAEAFDAIGTMAERLAQRASAAPAAGALTGVAPTRAEAALSAHLEVVARYGVVFKSYERDLVMRLCYDGEAYRRVLALQSQAQQRAHAALGLTRADCVDPQLPVSERQQLDEWRAEVLDRVDEAQLPGYLRNRVAMRSAGVWSGLAYQRTRRGDAAGAAAAAKRALIEFAAVDRAELADDDQAAYNDSAIRVSASRWAAALPLAKLARDGGIITAPGEAGATCVLLIDAKHDAGAPLVRRCTFGVVWTASATLDREGNALALAVQPMAAWRELWVFTRKPSGSWTLQVLPPSTASPELGYAEFAGWVPGGKQMLVARESRGDGRLKRSFDVVRLETLVTERMATDPSVLGPFQRWQDAGWKRETVSLR